MDIIIIKHTKSACLAQPVEHAAVNRRVGGSIPSTGAIERNRIAVSFLFLSFSSNPLTLFSPCTTSACRSVGENMLFRRALRSLRGSSPLAGAIVAARRTSQHLAQQRGVFASSPAAPLRVAKMQDVRCAPRSCGTIAPLPHFCSAGRLRRGFFLFIVLLEPPDAVIPHRKCFRRGPRFYTPQNIRFAGTPVLYPTKHTFCGDPGLMPSFLVTAENVFFNST